MRIVISEDNLRARGLSVRRFEFDRDVLILDVSLFGGSGDSIFNMDMVRSLKEHHDISDEIMDSVLDEAQQNIDRRLVGQIIFQED